MMRKKYPEINNLVKKVQTHHHATTFRKKKGAVLMLRWLHQMKLQSWKKIFVEFYTF